MTLFAFLTLDTAAALQWLSDNWFAIAAAGGVGILDFIFNNNPHLRDNTLADMLYRKYLRPLLGSAKKDEG